jgi:hypothetical protein
MDSKPLETILVVFSKTSPIEFKFEFEFKPR